ncbi:hypothetical protein Prudu_006545 [Prunus dulcis]|uniref:Uncharacterized protein n=1 Tax=Prunus dulcis TaxID=3755 RepID=A0A4Y1QZX3_PRUDU|nr:hypothetical protein Prudu_006545 [Prunus dulcis]
MGRSNDLHDCGCGSGGQELRKQLENHVVTIDTLHNENRLAVQCHENKLLVEVNRISAQTKHAIEDFNERLNGTKLSCSEANEIANSKHIDDLVNPPTCMNEINILQLRRKKVTRRRINFTVDNSEPSPTGQWIGFSVSSCSLVSEKYGKLASSI